MPARQQLGQGFIDAPVGAGDGLGADALDDIQRRQDDVPVAQRVKDAGSQHDALIRLQGQLGRCFDGLAVMGQTERHHAQVCPQFEQVFAPGFIALGVQRPACGISAQLPSDPLQQGHRHCGIGKQSLTRKAQQAQLHPYTEPVRVAAPLANQRQVGLAEGVEPDQLIFGIG